jgi:guanylate kinase
MSDHEDAFGFCVSHTTRDPRPGEEEGVHYYFTTRPEVEVAVAEGLFLEHAEVHGNMYGTSLKAVADVSALGKLAVLDIDVQGAEQVRGRG